MGTRIEVEWPNERTTSGRRKRFRGTLRQPPPKVRRSHKHNSSVFRLVYDDKDFDDGYIDFSSNCFITSAERHPIIQFLQPKHASHGQNKTQAATKQHESKDTHKLSPPDSALQPRNDDTAAYKCNANGASTHISDFETEDAFAAVAAAALCAEQANDCSHEHYLQAQTHSARLQEQPQAEHHTPLKEDRHLNSHKRTVSHDVDDGMHIAPMTRAQPDHQPAYGANPGSEAGTSANVYLSKQKRSDLALELRAKHAELEKAKKQIFELSQAWHNMSLELNEERRKNARLEEMLQGYRAHAADADGNVAGGDAVVGIPHS